MSSQSSTSRVTALPTVPSRGAADDAPVPAAPREATGYTGRFPGINPTLARQLREASGDTELSLETVLKVASRQYDEVDVERRGIVRSMQLMSEEARALTRELREQSASQLQAILDHVKDVILTVDERGCIQSFNPTGERVFGYSAAEIIGRPLGFLLPELTPDRERIAERLDDLALASDDTHVDLAAHETVGRTRLGVTFAAELAVSKAQVQRKHLMLALNRTVGSTIELC